MDQSGPMWTNVDQSGPISTNLDQSGPARPIWTNFYQSTVDTVDTVDAVVIVDNVEITLSIDTVEAI